MTEYSDEVYAFFAYKNDKDEVIRSVTLETLGEFVKNNNIDKKSLKLHWNFLYAITEKGLEDKISG